MESAAGDEPLVAAGDVASPTGAAKASGCERAGSRRILRAGSGKRALGARWFVRTFGRTWLGACERASARARHYLQSEHLSECINQDGWRGGALTSRPPSGQHAAHTHAPATSCCLLTELPSPHPRPEARGGDPIHCRVDTTCQGRDPAPHISCDVTNVPPSTQVPKVLSFFTCMLLK